MPADHKVGVVTVVVGGAGARWIARLSIQTIHFNRIVKSTFNLNSAQYFGNLRELRTGAVFKSCYASSQQL